MKELAELIDRDEPAWPIVQSWLRDATNPHRLLPRDPARAERELVRAQVTTRSPMGAILYETGGVLVDHGWLRLLGSGCAALDRGLAEWNLGKTFASYGGRPTHLLVADDEIGGFFAIDGGGLGGQPGHVHYLAPDRLVWASLARGYSDFVGWALAGDLDNFYKPFRWQGWQADVAELTGAQAFSFYPFLFTQEGKDVACASRGVVPVEESYRFAMEMQEKLGSG